MELQATSKPGFMKRGDPKLSLKLSLTLSRSYWWCLLEVFGYQAIKAF